MSRIYVGLALMEFGDAEACREVTNGLPQYVVQQLSPTAIVVDHEQLEALLSRLRRQGITPKVTDS
ncbi:MAG: hypothetical protein HYY04_13695 [Chloroflexi bacterium]|nr:hypothetical protein [Chloroflexota bacterium]